MPKLTLESFNDIIMGAMKDASDEKRLELYDMELRVVGEMLSDAVADLLDELEASGYHSEHFDKILNIKANTESLVNEAEALREKLKK